RKAGCNLHRRQRAQQQVRVAEEPAGCSSETDDRSRRHSQGRSAVQGPAHVSVGFGCPKMSTYSLSTYPLLSLCRESLLSLCREVGVLREWVVKNGHPKIREAQMSKNRRIVTAHRGSKK